MIDTVTIFKPQELVESDIPSSYRLTVFRQPHARGRPISGPTTSISYDDPDTGYHAYGEDGSIRYHRASLPRLLHGQNGNLIKDQVELDRALELLHAKSDEIGNLARSGYHFTRVDLVWQFRGDPARFILAHRHARHPRLRGDPVLYEARSLALEGSEMRIDIYDKTREQFKRNGDIVRVEVQLRGERLKEELGAGNRVTKLDFGDCYTAYRRIMLGFCPAAIPDVGTIGHFLAIGEREDWQAEGIPAFEIYTADLSDRQRRRLQKQMAAARPTVHQIDWAQLLPADGPPKPVDLDDIPPHHQHFRRP
jgi:hypothetical protein